ncbi:S-layer homology domain-containing protein [Solibacillus sp. CAU 1738]|uniref:S-layer homology domain-containing protein n=1 Tax=Solibacillus sp. CAU 1738 TaxID=3140363 RepID=UPI0032600F13
MANQPKKYKKFVATAATATLVASAIVPVASAASFTDVADTNSHAEAINALVEAGIIKGYEDGTFKPGATLTRGHVVKMLGKWVEAQGFEIPADYATKARFTDLAVDANDQELVKYAALVKDTGVFNGLADGSLNAKGDITRENMALTLDRAYKAVFGKTLVEVAEGAEELTVTDLATAKAEAREAIQALRNLGISNVDTFNPKDTVTRGQFASFLYRTINVADAPAELKVESVTAVNGTLTVKLAEKAEAVDVKDFTVTQAINGGTATEVTPSAAVLSEDGLTVTLTVDTVAAKETTEQSVVYTVNEVVAPAFVVEASTLAVDSVTAINGSTIQVKFTKAVKKSTVIESDGTLVNGAFKYAIDAAGSADNGLDAKFGELSEDGKTLTIYNAAKLEGNYVLTVTKDVVLTADGSKALPESKVKFNIKDTTRAAVESVTNESKYVFNINLTESVTTKDIASITATLADGTSVINGSATLINNGKTIQVTLVNNNNAVNAGKEVTITIPSLTDFAGNISVPTTQTVKVSNSDVTAPTVVSAVATSARTIEVTFDEAVTIDKTKFKFNGSTADTVIVNVEAKTGDTTKTKFVVTLAADQKTAAYLDLLAGAATDLSGNTLEATSKLVAFNADKTAPTIVSNSVQKIGGVNYLVLNFSEQVTLVGSSNLSFKYKDEYGVEQSLTLASPASAITANGTDGKSFKIELTNVSGLKTGTEYTVEFAKGYFKDAFLNDLEKTSVKFVNNSSESTSTKLVATIGNEGVDKDGRYIIVNFDKTVDPTSAEEAANYTVEGATVKEAKLASNTSTGASVKVYLTADTVELSGNYQVTVKNVKGFNSSITAVDETTATVAIKENVAAKVKSHSITFATNSTQIDLTFDENVTVLTGTDFDLYIDGVKSTATVATAQNGANVVRVTVTGLDLSSDIASTKKVVLKANSTFDIKDANSNVASTLDVTLN